MRSVIVPSAAEDNREATPSAGAAAALERIAKRFRLAAFRKQEDPTATMYEELADASLEAEQVAREHGLAPRTALTILAELLRATVLAGWFFNRAYVKPRGYAGDYGLIQAMYRGKPVSDDPLGALIDRTYLVSPCNRAVQNRRAFLKDQIVEHCVAHGTPILSLGCGPAQELVDASLALTENGNTSHVTVFLLDIDPLALDHAARQLLASPHFNVRTLRVDLRKFGPELVSGIGLAYSAGLFDYLNDGQAVALSDAVWKSLQEQGRFLIGNFRDRRTISDQLGMDYVMEWLLNYREETVLTALISRTRFGGVRSAWTEPEGINVFAAVER